MKSNDVILVKGDATEEKAKSTLFVILVIIGAVAAIAGIAYAVYRYLTPDYLEDFEDDFDDDFDDDDYYDEVDDDKDAKSASVDIDETDDTGVEE